LLVYVYLFHDCHSSDEFTFKTIALDQPQILDNSSEGAFSSIFWMGVNSLEITFETITEIDKKAVSEFICFQQKGRRKTKLFRQSR
jgi:hypothetical protein